MPLPQSQNEGIVKICSAKQTGKRRLFQKQPSRWLHAGNGGSVAIAVKVTEWLSIWRSSGPAWLLKQGHLWSIAQNHIQVAFGSKNGDPTTCLGNLCQCLDPHSEKCFLTFRGNLQCFSLHPLLLVLQLSTTEKCMALSSLHPAFRYVHTLMTSPCSFPSIG